MCGNRSQENMFKFFFFCGMWNKMILAQNLHLDFCIMVTTNELLELDMWNLDGDRASFNFLRLNLFISNFCTACLLSDSICVTWLAENGIPKFSLNYKP